jgi:hypothetical protein
MEDNLFNQLKAIEASQRAALKCTQDALKRLQPKEKNSRARNPLVVAEIRMRQAKQYKSA